MSGYSYYKDQDLRPYARMLNIRKVYKEANEMQAIMTELAPWASAAQDDPNCCDELKKIFLKVIDKAVSGDKDDN